MTALVLLCSAGGLLAQDDFVPVDTTIVMDPAMFDPAETGYFVGGVQRDLDEDGVPEFYNGCYDAYGDSDHKEDGEQNGWKYENVIIFRGCDLDAEDDVIKGTQPAENWPTVGNIIQITKHHNALSDSASFGYLASPSFTNLSSLTVKVGTDLSIGDHRQIFLLVEASKDGGETWEYVDNPDGEAFILQQLAKQGGDIHTYTADGSNEYFEAIVAASQEGPIQLRFTSMPPPFSDTDITNGERLKFWEITINAQTAPNTGGNGGGGGPLALNPDTQSAFTVKNYTFSATGNQDLFVYTLSGGLLGSGSEVSVCEGGLYIVKTMNSKATKVYLK